MNGLDSGFAGYITHPPPVSGVPAPVGPDLVKAFFLDRLALLGMDRTPFQDREIVGFSPAFEYISSPGLSRVDQVTVLSYEWVIVGEKAAYLNHCVTTPYPPRSAYFAPFGVMYPQVTQPEVDTAVLLGGCHNYCHWLFDFLPRLLMLPDHLQQVPMLVNGDFTRFQEESILALGLKPHLLKLAYPFACKVRHLLVMNIESCCTMAPFKAEVVQRVRAAYARYFAPGLARRKLWVSRATQKHARLVNADEAEAVAVAQGFEVVHLEALSFIDQVRLFSEAAVVAGPHGAGFANCVFSPPGLRLVELMSPEFERSYPPEVMFSFVAQVLGQHAERVVGESVGETEAYLVNQRYRVDLAALAARLAAAG